jgi:hypothetical protein
VQTYRLNPENEENDTTNAGNTDLKTTPTGIGAWAIGGGKWEFGLAAQNDAQSVAAIHAG